LQDSNYNEEMAMRVYNPSLEERAFLYQEAQDLAPLVKELGSLSILVEEEAKSGYRVTFLVAPESMGLQIHAENDNLFAATIAAKEEAQRQLNALINALNGTQATAQVLH
jgi:ribosome-associated translation inhibitor RaiA